MIGIIYSEKLGKLVAKASSLGIYYDYTALASCAVTEAVSQALNKLNQQ